MVTYNSVLRHRFYVHTLDGLGYSRNGTVQYRSCQIGKPRVGLSFICFFEFRYSLRAGPEIIFKGIVK